MLLQAQRVLHFTKSGEANLSLEEEFDPGASFSKDLQLFGNIKIHKTLIPTPVYLKNSTYSC